MACHVCHTRAAVDGGACDCCEAVRRLQRMVHSPALPPWPPQQLCCSGSRPRWPSLLNEPPRRTDSREPSRERSRSPRHSPEPPSRRREDGPEPEHRGHETKPWPLCWRPRALPIRAEAPARAPARGKAAAAGDEPWRLTRPSAAGRGGTPTCPWASVRVGEASRPGPPDETTQVGRQRERAWRALQGVVTGKEPPGPDGPVTPEFAPRAWPRRNKCMAKWGRQPPTGKAHCPVTTCRFCFMPRGYWRTKQPERGSRCLGFVPAGLPWGTARGCHSRSWKKLWPSRRGQVPGPQTQRHSVGPAQRHRRRASPFRSPLPRSLPRTTICQQARKRLSLCAMRGRGEPRLSRMGPRPSHALLA